MRIKLKRLYNDVELPKYQTTGAAAFDIEAHLDVPLTLQPLERLVIPTGFALELPNGYELQIRARSGLALKQGLVMANGIGTVDSDYRGEIGVILINLDTIPHVINPGDRIAQGVITPSMQVSFIETDQIDDTERGASGYGSTGVSNGD